MGTGSTASLAIRALAEEFPGARFDCVASSRATEELARSLGIPDRPLRGDDRFDLMLDGADEVDPSLDLTKGGGGALLREKRLARLSDLVVILIDPTKLVQALGERVPIPIEVVPFASAVVAREVAAMGFRATRRMTPGNGPFHTDNGNEILDLVPPEPLAAPRQVEESLRRLVGVVETGIFVDLVDRLVIGHPDGTVDERARPTPRPR